MAGNLKTNSIQLGDSATASQNFVLQTNVDGTAKLARGNLGATTQDILTVDAAGKVVTPVMPFVGTAPIVESGSNVNGSWVKWADGTMVCTGIYGSGIATSTFLLTFPMPFINVDYDVSGNCGFTTADFGQLVKCGTPATSGITVGWAYGRTLFTTASYTRWTAIGRWKA